MIRSLDSYRAGLVRPVTFQRAFTSRRSQELALTPLFRINSLHDASVMSIDVESAENRYLLTTGGTRLCVYDLAQRRDEDLGAGGAAPALMPIANTLAFVSGANRFGLLHRNSISSLCWYPHDSGMFLTGSFDHCVRVWDTNAMEPISGFNVRALVYRVALSPCAGTHSLVAVACESSHVPLCDLRTNKAAHTLMGAHDTSMRCCAWSPSDESLLATADAGGCMRLWDIRRARGALLAFDMARTAPFTTGDSLAAIDDVADDAASRAKRRKVGAAGSATSMSALAHDAAVTSLCFTADGALLLSSARDRMRLWRTATGANTLVNYAQTHNTVPFGHSIALSNDERTVLHPNGRHIGVYELTTGALRNTLRGHFEQVTSVVYRRARDELVSASADRQLLVWLPESDRLRTAQSLRSSIAAVRGTQEHGDAPHDRPRAVEETLSSAVNDRDTWSDDE
jgi:DNA excision repair protein ERCC-8